MIYFLFEYHYFCISLLQYQLSIALEYC
uniref:Uncharacterized protein n=1 Tax=Anguilla anguilla TaxID=7936 RepID=A0A0E9ULI8_ANGAN